MAASQLRLALLSVDCVGSHPPSLGHTLYSYQRQLCVPVTAVCMCCRVELGRTHLRLGHKRDAYQHLLASMELEVEDINAKLQKEDAELLLAKLQSELKGRTELPASWGGFTAPGIAQIEAAPDSSSSCNVEEVEADSSSSSSGGVPGGAGAA